MSKLATLITSLVLGTSSIAAADPSFSFSASASWSTSGSDQPLVRDHRLPVERARVDRWSWIALSQPMTAGRRNVIRVYDGTELAALRMQLTGGMTYIYDVDVRFADGTHQSISLNRWLWTSSPSLQLALSKRSVDTITIRSWGGRSGAFQVFGQSRELLNERPLPPVYQPQPPVYQPPVYQPRTSFLAGRDLTFANTLGYKYVLIGADKGRFGTMRIQPTRGSIYLTYVQVDFANGASQVLQPHRTIDGYYDFQLDGNGTNAISQIILKTNDSGAAVTDESTFNLVLF